MSTERNRFIVEHYIDDLKEFQECCRNFSSVVEDLRNFYYPKTEKPRTEKTVEITDWFLNFMFIINKLCVSLYHFCTGEDVKNYNPTLCRNFYTLEEFDYYEKLDSTLNNLSDYINQFKRLPFIKDEVYFFSYYKSFREESEFFSTDLKEEDFMRLRNLIWDEIQNLLSIIISAYCDDDAYDIIQRLNTATISPRSTDKSVSKLFRRRKNKPTQTVSS